jgi:hypothetical protein
MKRPASAENNLERLRAWRAVCPEMTVRSTFITGFPGETEADFEELLAFIAEARLDRVGCFAYSPVDGAAANAFAGRGAGGGSRGTPAAADGVAGRYLGGVAGGEDRPRDRGAGRRGGR